MAKKLKYSWFTMTCYFQAYSTVIQLYICLSLSLSICLFSSRLLSLIDTKYWESSPVLYNRSYILYTVVCKMWTFLTTALGTKALFQISSWIKSHYTEKSCPCRKLPDHMTFFFSFFFLTFKDCLGPGHLKRESYLQHVTLKQRIKVLLGLEA